MSKVTLELTKVQAAFLYDALLKVDENYVYFPEVDTEIASDQVKKDLEESQGEEEEYGVYYGNYITEELLNKLEVHREHGVTFLRAVEHLPDYVLHNDVWGYCIDLRSLIPERAKKVITTTLTEMMMDEHGIILN